MRTRGFSMVELLAALVMLSFVFAGVSGVLIVQAQMATAESLRRDEETNARLALTDLSRAVRMAGYGIPPGAAFDFDRFGCGTPNVTSTCPNGSRDRVSLPDELVVAYRDPLFSRQVSAISGSASPWTLTFSGGLPRPVLAGQLLQLVCAGGDPAAYLAVSVSTTSAGATSLTARSVTSTDGYLPTLNPTDTCFASASLFLVERQRYFVATSTADPVPALYRDRGRGVVTGGVAGELLYRGIEDVQISFDIGQPPSSSLFASVTPPETCGATTGWTFGSCSGTRETIPTLTATTPDWKNDLYDSANRYTANPANIRSVTLSVVSRATQDAYDQIGDPVEAIGNRPARARDAYRRSVLTVTEKTPNLLIRSIFVSLNVGGG